MKKTYNISLGGYLFHLEEDAGDKLQEYITTLEHYYSREEGGNEIMSDIENRIAELFQQFIETPEKSVITLNEVDKVITIMGKPDELIDEDHSSASNQEKPVRKLYRDTRKGIFGGVSAGLSAYFDVPVLLFRLLFIVFAFFYGITLLIYFILWILIPAATTPKQKLEMKGERINISTLEKNIKSSIEEMKSNGKARNFLKSTGDVIYRILISLGNIIAEITTILLKIISVILIVLSLAMMFLVLRILFGHPFGLADWTWIDLPHFMSFSYTLLTQIALLLICFPPLLFIFWISLKYLFSLKAKSTVISFSLLACWISGIILLLYIGFNQSFYLKEENEAVTITPLQLPDKHLVVTLRNQSSPHIIYSRNSNVGYHLRNKATLLFVPRVKIEPDKAKQAQLTVIRKANGSSLEDAYDNAKKLEYNWELLNDTLYLDNYFYLPPDTKWRNNKMELILSLPENYTIYLDETLKRYLLPHHWLNVDTYNQTYRITSDGLKK